MPSAGITRMTSQRRVILEELAKVATHPTADELYEQVRRRLPRISLGTVYRNLEVLALAGKVNKVCPADRQRRFDAALHLHYHIRCSECGRVDDVSLQPSRRLEKTLREVCDYDVTGHSLVFMGICPECQNGRTPPA